MKLLSKLAIGACALGLGLSAPAAKADQPTLNLFIWSDYIDPNLIKAFEKQCNCKVQETDYESNAEMEAKLKTGGVAVYDVVVPSSYYVPEMADEGLIQKLNHSKLPNISNLAPRFQNPDYDPNNQYSVPYQWGTTGVLYNPAKIKTNPTSWGLLFDPKENPNYPFVIPKVKAATRSAPPAPSSAMASTAPRRASGSPPPSSSRQPKSAPISPALSMKPRRATR